MRARGVSEYAGELHYALEDAQSTLQGATRQIGPLMEKAEGRLTEDELVVVARDAEELAGILREAADDLRGTAREIQARLPR
jgi:hypothetical protein